MFKNQVRSWYYVLAMNSILLFIPARAVLVRFDHLKLPGNKNIYLFFELHDPWSVRDSQQLENLSKMLALRDQLKFPPMHLLVEVPSLLAQEGSQGRKVTYDIIDHVAHCPLIAAKDIEIRCHSGATYSILGLSEEQLGQESLPIEQYNAGDHWCNLGDITVETLKNELNGQQAEICGWLDHRVSMQPFYVSKCAELHTSKSSLATFLEGINSRGDERIIDLVKRLYGSFDLYIQRLRLRKIISDYCLHIFDVHILRTMLMSQYDHCMIIAGNLHSEWICHALEHFGGQYKVSEGSKASQLDDKDFKIIQAAMGLPV